MQDENDIISVQDTKENKNDTLQRLITQARRHKVKESRLKAKEVNLGEPDLDIEWHAAPYLKKCYCPAEPCICQSHLLKAGYLPHRLHYIKKDPSEREPPHTLVPRLAAAVKAEMEISKQLQPKLEQRGPEFCASNCRAFLQPVKEGGYHAERKKLVEKYIKDNNLEMKMKHYIKVREGKCLQQIQNRRKLEERLCIKERSVKPTATQECDMDDEKDDVEDEEFEEDTEQTMMRNEQSLSTDNARAVPHTGTYTKLAKESNEGKWFGSRTMDTCTSPQSDDRIVAHRQVDCKETRSIHTNAGPIEGMDEDRECNVLDGRRKSYTTDCETDPVDINKDDCDCTKRECRSDYEKRTPLTNLDVKGPIGRKYFSLI